MSRATRSSLLSLRTLKKETQSSKLRLQEQLKKINCFYVTEVHLKHSSLFTKLIIFADRNTAGYFMKLKTLLNHSYL